MIPQNQIEKIVKDSIGKNREEFREQLENYLNNEHFQGLIGYMLDKNRVKDDQHGTLVKAAVSFNPNNLVRGPLPKHRENDPDSGFDTEIVNAQPSKVKDAVTDAYKTRKFEDFTNLPHPEPVSWKQNSENKYFIPETTIDQPQQVILIYKIQCFAV